MLQPSRGSADPMPRRPPQVVVWLAAALLLSVAATLLLRIPDDGSDRNGADSPLAQDYDYYINDMVLDRLSHDGSPEYHLTAQRVTHYPSPELSELENPTLHWFQPQRPTWILTAQRGELRPDSEDNMQLQLRDEVHASRSLEGGDTLHIRSARLLVLPDSGEASSDVTVTIDSSGTHLEGAAMQAWLAEDRIKLAAGSGRHD